MAAAMTSPFLRQCLCGLSIAALLASSPQPLLAQQKPVVTAAPAAPAVAVDRAPWLYAGSDMPQDPAWQFGRLDNGLRFVIRHNAVPAGQVTIRLRVDAGSLMEEPREAGWAHLVEHLAFRESRYLPSGEARRAWQRLGITFGSDSNAATTPTSTTYQLDIPSASPESLMQSMQYLSGMVREPVLTDATIDAERRIVIAERRELDGPEFRIRSASIEHMFAGQRLSEWPTIGTEATLSAANADGIRAFHRRWYRPDRVIIVISGDLDPSILETSITRHFADWQASGQAPVEPDFGRPDPSAPVARIVVEPTQPMVAQLTYIRPWTRVTDTVSYTQGLILNIVAQLIVNRRLEERARGGGKFLGAEVEDDKLYRSAWLTNLTVVPLDGDWRGAIGDARSVVDAATAQPPTPAEIERELDALESVLLREAANVRNEPGTKLAEDLLEAVDVGEILTSTENFLAIWRLTRPLATPEEMLARTRTLLSGDARRVLLTTPTAIVGGETQLAAAITAPAAALADAGQTGTAPTFADLPALGAPGTLVSRTPIERLGMERWELSNGITALVRDIPLEPDKIRIRVRFGAGRRGLSPDAGNLLWSDSALVVSGLGELDQSALDRLVNGRQLGMGFAVDDDAFELSAETRREDLADQLRLLATQLTAPGWRSTPVQRQRAQLLLSYDSGRASPLAVMQNQLQSVLYSGDRRFAPPTRAEIEALTPEAFRAFWEPRLQQGPIEIQIFGDIGPTDLPSMLLSTFGALAPRPAAAPPTGASDVVPTPPPPSPIIVRHGGGATQAAAILSYSTGGGLDAIRTARQLEILAALFNNRLYERLRDAAGASYSQAVISNWPKSFDHAGYLFVGGLVRPEDTDLVLRSAREIAAELIAAPATADELQRAIGPAAEQVVRNASGNVFWMYETSNATRDPRVFRSLNTYMADLTRVTPAELQALAARYLRPERAVPVLILPEGGSGDAAR